MLMPRLSFETEQLKNTRERLESLEATINSEKAGLAELQKNQKTLEAELSQAESEIEELRAEVETAQDDYQQAAKASEDAKAAAASAQKALDLVLREIAASVRLFTVVGTDCRMTKSKDWPQTVVLCTAAASSRTLIFRWSRDHSTRFRLTRYVISVRGPS